MAQLYYAHVSGGWDLYDTVQRVGTVWHSSCAHVWGVGPVRYSFYGPIVDGFRSRPDIRRIPWCYAFLLREPRFDFAITGDHSH